VTSAIPSLCDFVGCEEEATGRYPHTWHNGAVAFIVCSAHFARITDGERPVIVTAHVDQSKSEGGRALLFE
jgi:hypothetical protein